MTTTPDEPISGDARPDDTRSDGEGAPGAEIGIDHDGGSTFEPEEDAEGSG